MPDTDVLLNLSVPSLAASAARLPAAGVGLMRAEFIALQLGRHPRHVVEQDGADALVSVLRAAIETVAAAFHPRPVLYRSLDLKSNEYRGLAGGDRFEVDEANPMLGLRGAARYLRHPIELELELAALSQARAAGWDNVSLMVPFVRTPDELGAVRGMVEESGLLSQDGFELWAMAEVPAIVLEPEPFAALVDGLSIGTNDLEQLLLGVDRDAPSLGWEEQDHRPLLLAMERIIAGAHAAGARVSTCGDAVSRDEALLRDLVALGIDSVSVVPDAFAATAAIVGEAAA